MTDEKLTWRRSPLWPPACVFLAIGLSSLAFDAIWLFGGGLKGGHIPFLWVPILAFFLFVAGTDARKLVRDWGPNRHDPSDTD